MINGTLQEGLRVQVLRAGFWTVVGYVAETLIRLASTLVLTRLLVPEDFGLIAVAATIPVSLAMLLDVGIPSSIVSKSGALDPNFLRTAWTVQAIRGMVLCFFTLILAALLCVPLVRQAMPVNSLLSHHELPLLLAAMGSIPAISGFESANIYVQARNIHFRPLVLRSLLSKIVPVPVMIGWALLYPSVWSLVAGALVGHAVLTFSSYVLVPGVPMKFSLDRQHTISLLNDGKWIALSTAGTFFVTQGDRLVLATMLTGTQMGLYAIALTLVEVFRSFLSRLHGQITLPILSTLFRTRPLEAISIYYRYRRPIEALAFSSSAFLWIAAPAIVRFLYDDRYTEAGWILQVLGLSLASFPYMMINMAYIANDEWRAFSSNSTILVGAFFVAIFLGYSLTGWTGVIWGIALYSWPASFILLARAYRKGWINPISEIATLPFAFVGIALGYATLWILHQFGVPL